MPYLLRRSRCSLFQAPTTALHCNGTGVIVGRERPLFSFLPEAQLLTCPLGKHRGATLQFSVGFVNDRLQGVPLRGYLVDPSLMILLHGVVA